MTIPRPIGKDYEQSRALKSGKRDILRLSCKMSDLNFKQPSWWEDCSSKNWMDSEGRAWVNPLFSGRNELETGPTFETFQHAYFSKFASL